MSRNTTYVRLGQEWERWAVSGQEGDFSADVRIGDRGDGPCGDAVDRLSDTLAEAVAKAVAHCQAAGAGKEEAEDCVQDAVVAMLTSMPSDAPVRRPEAWLKVVARRRLVDR